MGSGGQYTHKCGKEAVMSTYKVVELVGTSQKSWEDAARTAVEQASGSLKNLRVEEVVKMDMTVEGGSVLSFRTRVNLSFKIEK